MHILYADDDAVSRRAGQLILRRSGHRVDIAADGAEAWSALCDGNYDLLITDNRMPRLSGFELIRKVRRARMMVPIIMASGSLDELPVDELLWLECGPLLPKPFTPEQLLSAVSEVARARASAGAGATPAQQPSVGERLSSGFNHACHWGINEWINLRRIDYAYYDSPLQRFVTVGD